MKTNKPKFKVVIFYGAFAVGKYTTAKEFHKKTGFKFFHNHHSYNIARELFERNTVNIDRLTEKLRLDIFEEVAKANLNVVSTHAYSADYVSLTGLSDPALVKQIETIIKQAGGATYFVHLKTNADTLLKRVSNNGRKKLNKLTDINVMKGILAKKHDWNTSAPVKNNLEIDNTNLSPKQVVKKVLDFIHF